MAEKNTFNTEEERQVEELLVAALSIEDEQKRELFIRKQCGNNPSIFHRVMADLAELISGEGAQLRPVIKEGEEIGNYKIIEKIKQGGFATVYKAEHKISKTFAAIKIFDKLVSDAEKDLIWNKEGKSLSKLDHDNIVKFYDLGFYEKDGKRLPYVIVELVKGKHLDEHCKVKDPSVRDVLSLFRSLCGVIEYIHSKEKILHLDLKPSNIFVTAARPYRIKLIDFGSSKLFRNEPRRLTRNDFINLLSIKFASPEQFDKDEEIDHQSDIYSLGAVLYLLLTEKVPFGEGAANKEEIKREVTDINLSPVPPSTKVLEIDKETKFGLSPKSLSKVLKGDLDFIVLKCLQKRRRNRYKNILELNQDIDNFLKGKPIKARQKPFGYKTFKSISRLFGIRGGLFGWAKWKSPIKRFAVLGIILALLGLIGYRLFGNAPKRIEKTAIDLRIRKDDQTQNKIRVEGLYIICKQEPCFSFLEIPSGSFEMGKRENEHFDLSDEEKNALPVRKLNIEKIYMSRFEITNKQWNIVATLPKKYIDLEVAEVKADEYSLPKTNISYSKAKEFCERLSADLSSQTGRTIIARLPTEAEWEYACRAGTLTRYGGGNEFDWDFINAKYIVKEAPAWDVAILNKLQNKALPDSSFIANPFGLAAMNGNVWEMVSDSWHANYENAPQDGSSWEPIDLRSSDKSKSYVLRGGAFNRPDYMCQCSYRTDGRFISPGNEQTGFRVVLEAKGID